MNEATLSEIRRLIEQSREIAASDPTKARILLERAWILSKGSN